MSVDNLMEHLDICSSIANDSFNEPMVAICTKRINNERSIDDYSFRNSALILAQHEICETSILT